MADVNNAEEFSQKWWLTEVTNAENWLKKEWWTTADNVVDRYLDIRSTRDDYVDENDKKKYNIFWANVSIIKSALYATPPQPRVKRTHDDAADDVARVASLILERLLEADLNPDDGDMHAAFLDSVDDRLIPGLGQVWLRYEAEVKDNKVGYECVHTEYVHWKDFLFPEIRRWNEKTWLGRRVWMKKKHFVSKFGQARYDQLKQNYENQSRTDGDEPKGFKRGKIEVFELWCEDTNKVYWINRHSDDILDTKDDLYQLDSFYPCPEPLLATHTTNKFIPRSDYTMAADQYEELDTLNDRIYSLTKALRVVGAYDKTNAELKSMLSGPELSMVPVDNWDMFAEKGGFKGTVDWFPVDVVSKVLMELEEKRERVVIQIYQLTSISDIQRGTSNARETLGAQKLKAQYSSVRLQLMQQSVGKFIRQAMKLKCEMACRLYQPETLISRSNILNSESGKDQALVQQAVALLKSFDSTKYRIEVGEETLSLADYNAERELRTEYIVAVGQFLSQAGKIMEFAPQSLPYLLQMVQWVTSSFRGSDDIETVLDAAISMAQRMPPPQGDNSDKVEQIKSQTQLQLAQIKEHGDNERTKLVEANKFQIAEMNNGVKILIEKMGAYMESMSQQNEMAGKEREAQLSQATQRADQIHEMLMQLVGGQQEMAQQVEAQNATAQEGEAQRQHEREQAKQELMQQMKEVSDMLKKKRVRTPEFDDEGNLLRVVDELETEDDMASK